MKTFEEYWKIRDPYFNTQWWEDDSNEETWNDCLKEVAEELRNIIEYEEDSRNIEERLIDFTKKIFEETHDE